jgi:transposase-like protein
MSTEEEDDAHDDISDDDEDDEDDEEGEDDEVPTSGAGRRTRKRYSIQEKASIIRTVDRMMQRHGMTRNEACWDLHINPKLVYKWMKVIDAQLIAKKENIKAKSIHNGKVHSLEEHKDVLLQFIFELREQGMAVSVNMVAAKASQVSASFNAKSQQAKYHSARRFIYSQGLVFRLGTNESQRSPLEVAAEALTYMQTVARPKVSQEVIRHEDFILNMDQTPIPFTFHARKTINTPGSPTVHIRKSTCDTRRATYAVTVTASGKLLKPLVIFKGKPSWANCES